MRNLKLILTYDGTDFSGWQRQPDRRSVQQVLEEAVAPLNGGVVPSSNASGRTDAGVHALGQVVHFLNQVKLPTATVVKALNATLPPDVRVKSATDVSQAFHATLDTKSKVYRYVIDNGPTADPFQLRYSHHVYQPLDLAAMTAGAQHIVGRHDFHSFETHWPNRTSSVRTVYRVTVSRMDRFVWIDVEADGFLYNMVRTIAGTLILVGQGRWAPDQVGKAIAAEDRQAAGPTAPPQGLFLVRVRYPGDP